MKLNKGKPFKNHWQFLAVVEANPGGGGVLPYETLTGTCGPIGYGFQGVLS